MGFKERYSDFSKRSGSLFSVITDARFPQLFLLGAVLLAIIGNGVYDLLKIAFGETPQVIASIVLLSFLSLIVTVVALYIRLINKFPEKEDFVALILFYGFNAEPARISIKQHLYSGKLEHCFLIVTQLTEAKVPELVESLPTNNIKFHIFNLVLDANVATISELIKEVLGEATLFTGGKPIIVDITSGTKEMTVGAVLACRELDVPMQFVKLQFATDGRPIPGSATVVRL
jgi:hypothetical protein